MSEHREISEKQKEKIKESLIKAGAILRDKPLTPNDSFYSRSVGTRKTGIVTSKDLERDI